jgi:hypothetical protein
MVERVLSMTGGRRELRHMVIVALACLSVGCTSYSDEQAYTMTTNPKLRQWNAYVDGLLKLNEQRLAQVEHVIEETISGYGGVMNDMEYFRDIRAYDASSGKLLSSIKWETRNPDVLHMVDIYIYDDQGRLLREYNASYLPGHTNAPYETLINLHYHDGALHSFRQFDASGELLYQQCTGEFADEPVALAHEYYDMPDDLADVPAQLHGVYRACFDEAPDSAHPYTDPLHELSGLR